MNIEKVLDLAVQADPATVQTLGEIGGRSFIAANGIRPQYIQKFAELIVKECAHLVGGYTKENEFGTDVKEAYEEITKHFGVE